MFDQVLFARRLQTITFALMMLHSNVLVISEGLDVNARLSDGDFTRSNCVNQIMKENPEGKSATYFKINQSTIEINHGSLSWTLIDASYKINVIGKFRISDFYLIEMAFEDYDLMKLDEVLQFVYYADFFQSKGSFILVITSSDLSEYSEERSETLDIWNDVLNNGELPKTKENIKLHFNENSVSKTKLKKRSLNHNKLFKSTSFLNNVKRKKVSRDLKINDILTQSNENLPQMEGNITNELLIKIDCLEKHFITEDLFLKESFKFTNENCHIKQFPNTQYKNSLKGKHNFNLFKETKFTRIKRNALHESKVDLLQIFELFWKYFITNVFVILNNKVYSYFPIEEGHCDQIKPKFLFKCFETFNMKEETGSQLRNSRYQDHLNLESNDSDTLLNILKEDNVFSKTAFKYDIKTTHEHSVIEASKFRNHRSKRNALIIKDTTETLSTEKDSYRLNGCVIKFFAIPMKPYVGDEADFELNSGFAYTIFREVTKALRLHAKELKHPYKSNAVKLANGKTWNMFDKFSNGSYSGLYQDILEGRGDLVLGPITISAGEDFHFTYSHVFIKLHFFVPTAKPVETWKSMLHIFQKVTWICLLAATIIYVPVWHWIMKTFTVVDAIFIILRAFINSLTIRPEALQKRLILITWVLFCFLIINFYQALRISFLMTPSFEKQIRTFEDLTKSGLKIIGLRSSLDAIYFTSDTFLKKLYDISEQVLTFSINDWENVVNGKLVIFTSSTIAGTVLEHNFTPESTKLLEPSFPLYGTMALKRGSPFVAEISYIIKRMHETGLIIKWMPFIPKNVPIRSDSEYTTITMVHLKLAFYLYVGGVICAILVFICEIIYKKLFHTAKIFHSNERNLV